MSCWSDSSRSGKHLIYITHFFNPHHFWFKYVDENESNQVELCELDAKIHQYATKCRPSKKLSWRIGDIIAAYNVTWNKWVRGKVENVIEVENGTPRYLLWAIDYGLPMNVIAIYTSPLPKELAEFKSCSVYEGCSYGIMPATQTLDIVNFEPKMVPTKEWPKEAITASKDILKSAAYIVFEINNEFIDTQYKFGSLRVQLFNGDIKDVSKFLKNLHCVMEIDDFDSEIEGIKSRNKSNRLECSRSDILDSDDCDEDEDDSVASSDSGSDYAQATLNWINNSNVPPSNAVTLPAVTVAISPTNIESFDDVPEESRTISAGSQRQSRLEKLKAQMPRFARPLKSPSNSDRSHDLDDTDTRQVEKNVTSPTGRWRLLNLVPIPSGHERETDKFLKCNPKDLL